VLLFGATGLTGAHLLRYLIKLGGAGVVYCVVRSSTPEGGMARIEKAMRLLKVWKDSFAKHIVALPGDMALPCFGLKDEEYDVLAGQVTSIVHAGGSRKWHMDSESIQCNISGLMNVITLARKSTHKAQVHYISSGWLDAEDCADEKDKAVLRQMPYVQIKRKAEDLLHFAARQYKVPAFAYRLPLVSVNGRGGFAGDFIVFSVMQSLFETNMLPAEMSEGSSYPIMPADLAAKWVVRMMGRAPRRSGKKALVLSASPFSEVLTTLTLAQWVETLKGSRISRNASMESVKDYYHQKLIPEVRDLQAGFIEFLAALGRASDNLRRKVSHPPLSSLPR
jgi:thioester reductase-like protein